MLVILQILSGRFNRKSASWRAHIHMIHCTVIGPQTLSIHSLLPSHFKTSEAVDQELEGFNWPLGSWKQQVTKLTRQQIHWYWPLTCWVVSIQRRTPDYPESLTSPLVLLPMRWLTFRFKYGIWWLCRETQALEETILSLNPNPEQGNGFQSQN